MTNSIQFPTMRALVVDALRALSDPDHQRAKWGKYDPTANYYDDLDVNIHTLYDDTTVLTDPELAVPGLLYPSEVSSLRAVDRVLGSMIRDLGDRPDEEYLSDPRWPGVVRAAGEALAVLIANDSMNSRRNREDSL